MFDNSAANPVIAPQAPEQKPLVEGAASPLAAGPDAAGREQEAGLDTKGVAVRTVLYGPGGVDRIFEPGEEIPEGWADHPGKVAGIDDKLASKLDL